MLLPAFGFGLLAGVLQRAIRHVATSEGLAAGASALLFTQHLMSYDGSFPKLLGGMLQLTLLLLAMLWAFGRIADRNDRAPVIGPWQEFGGVVRWAGAQGTAIVKRGAMTREP